MDTQFQTLMGKRSFDEYISYSLKKKSLSSIINRNKVKYNYKSKVYRHFSVNLKHP